jgi:RNA polymerase sigma-70 factor (ECF subfamily)
MGVTSEDRMVAAGSAPLPPPSWDPVTRRGVGPEGADVFVRRLCADHGDAVFAWARGRFDDRRDAEEVVAETMVRAWRRHHQYDPERGSERSWIFGIAKNTAVDHFRRNRRHLRVVGETEVPEDLAAEVPVDRIAESTLVREALGDLSGSHREVLVLAHFGGLTVTEIAERLGVPAGTVKSRLYYAMRSLRGALEERGILH